MKHLLLAVMLVGAGCSVPAGDNPATRESRARCPTTQEQGDRSLTKSEWRACFGRQDDQKSGPGR